MLKRYDKYDECAKLKKVLQRKTILPIFNLFIHGLFVQYVWMERMKYQYKCIFRQLIRILAAMQRKIRKTFFAFLIFNWKLIFSTESSYNRQRFKCTSLLVSLYIQWLCEVELKNFLCIFAFHKISSFSMLRWYIKLYF